MARKNEDRVSNIEILFYCTNMSINKKNIFVKKKGFKEDKYQPKLAYDNFGFLVDDDLGEQKIKLNDITNIVVKFNYKSGDSIIKTVGKLDSINYYEESNSSEFVLLNLNIDKFKNSNDIYFKKNKNVKLVLNDYDGNKVVLSNYNFDVTIKGDKFHTDNDDVILIDENNNRITTNDDGSIIIRRRVIK